MKLAETEMVHATFYYPKKGGSQFIIDRLAQGLNLHVSTPITAMSAKDRLVLNADIVSDAIVYCGDVRRLPKMLEGSVEIPAALRATIENLPSNGTSNILCEFDGSDLSWLYFPESKFKNHRIINTGNFSVNNNGPSPRKTCVVEFSGKHSLEEMSQEIKKLPGNLKPIDHNYEANSYIIDDLRKILVKKNIYLLGRFAEWEYYNMDKCVEASMSLHQQLHSSLL
jgi:UDP-galactopyranose mutase